MQHTYLQSGALLGPSPPGTSTSLIISALAARVVTGSAASSVADTTSAIDVVTSGGGTGRILGRLRSVMDASGAGSLGDEASLAGFFRFLPCSMAAAAQSSWSSWPSSAPHESFRFRYYAYNLLAALLKMKSTNTHYCQRLLLRSRLAVWWTWCPTLQSFVST